MRFLGAKVVLTPAAERGMGMVHKAQELAKSHGWFLTRQFENEANPDMHERTTAREIIDDFKGEKLDYWVTGFGTGGTLTGVSRVLRKERPDTKIVVCEPADAPMLSSHSRRRSAIRTARRPSRHPSFKPHPMQGWSPDFIPKITAEAVDTERDRPHHHHRRRRRAEMQPRSGAEGRHLRRHHRRRHLCRRAGSVQERQAGRSTVLAMLPDTGERYLSTPLFGDIGADMNEDELKISNSTPNHRMPPKARHDPAIVGIPVASEYRCMPALKHEQ